MNPRKFSCQYGFKPCSILSVREACQAPRRAAPRRAAPRQAMATPRRAAPRQAMATPRQATQYERLLNDPRRV